MIGTFHHKAEKLEFDPGSGIDLSLPLNFTGENVSSFGAGQPSKKPYSTKGFLGFVRKGGSCNCDTIEFTPHAHGTHTECVGHILSTPLTVPEVFERNFFIAHLLTIDCEKSMGITAQTLWEKTLLDDVNALILRTTPNSLSKLHQQYDDRSAYMTKDAIEWMNKKNIQHLLVDFPSIDPIQDGGKLEAHRAFWNLSPQQKELDANTWKHKTVTELVYVPDEVPDGRYILDLQISHFMLDAVPSTPVLYPIKVKG